VLSKGLLMLVVVCSYCRHHPWRVRLAVRTKLRVRPRSSRFEVWVQLQKVMGCGSRHGKN
jgi:hypothetical protein